MALGALLNTRGLVELIVLNIAYNAHIFSSTLFARLVVMAFITTASTAPILNWLKAGSANTPSQDLTLVNVPPWEGQFRPALCAERRSAHQ